MRLITARNPLLIINRKQIADLAIKEPVTINVAKEVIS